MQTNVALWLNKMLKRAKADNVVVDNDIIRNRTTKGCFGRGPFESRVPKWYGTRSK